MKIKGLMLTMVATCAMSSAVMAQEDSKGVKYRRSSLHTILVESDKFPKKDVIIAAYESAPFPSKYNNHMVGARSFNPMDTKYALTEAEMAVINKDQSKASALAESKLEASLLEAKYLPFIVDKYLIDAKVGKQLVAKWFNRTEAGGFDMDLIKERGCFDASAGDISAAHASARGTSALDGAGKELIPNTFVVVNRMNFIENEPAAALVKVAALKAASKLKGPLIKAAQKTAEETFQRTKEGYTVWATSYLYKLNWSDSLLQVLYKQYWTDGKDADKVAAFIASELFTVEYVGTEKSSSVVLPDVTGKRTEDETITLATIRTVDAVYAKLQKKYEVFRAKTPLFSGKPIIAQIGMKEGIVKGDKFDVLEAVMDPKTGIIEYKNKGTITVQDPIWDNNYGANEEGKEATGTKFKGGKKFYSGMLIRQAK